MFYQTMQHIFLKREDRPKRNQIHAPNDALGPSALAVLASKNGGDDVAILPEKL